MRPLQDLLGKSAIPPEVLRAARAVRLLENWPEVVGADMARRSRPDRYEKGTVWVAVEGSAWAQELRMRSEVILQRLNGLSSDPTLFVSVRFGVRPIQPAARSTAVVAEPARRRRTIAEIMESRLAQWQSEERTEG